MKLSSRKLMMAQCLGFSQSPPVQVMTSRLGQFPFGKESHSMMVLHLIPRRLLQTSMQSLAAPHWVRMQRMGLLDSGLNHTP
jgi:hypothetical protein